jgi:transposase
VVQDVQIDDDVIVARVRPRANARLRCSRCLRPAARYDRGVGQRRWRHLDAGTIQVFIEVNAPRVACWACGINVPTRPNNAQRTLNTHNNPRIRQERPK